MSRSDKVAMILCRRRLAPALEPASVVPVLCSVVSDGWPWGGGGGGKGLFGFAGGSVDVLGPSEADPGAELGGEEFET